jgi:hypothetical protein
MKKRKIQLVVKKVSFAQAEAADDLYWSKTSPEQRLNTLAELRNTFFGSRKPSDYKIAKVITKRSLYEKAD